MSLPPTSLAISARLRASRHWVFDLDGTLTVAMHDFEALRRAIGCPSGAPILEWLATQSIQLRSEKQQTLDALEAELCDHAQAAAGAHQLVEVLQRRGCTLGVLTRNSRDNALRTLRAIGLSDAFIPAQVLGRDEAPAKPDPAGLLKLASDWGVGGDTLIMVGDFVFDLQAGRAAGALTVHADERDQGWPEHTDVRIRSLHELLHQLP